MKSEAILYVPSDTPEAMMMATRKVAGVPLIVRGIMTLARAGVKRCTLLTTESQRSKIERFLSRYRPQDVPELEIFHYDEPYGVTPEIVTRIAETLDEHCLLINANLIFDHTLIDAIRKEAYGKSEVVLCREGAHPIPIYEISRSLWSALAPFTSPRPRSIESCLRQIIELSTPVIATKSPSINTFLVTHPRDRAVAEKSLAEEIRLSTTGPIAKCINKRLSLPASMIMAKLWISPNAITAFNIFIGVFSGVFVADGHRYLVILFGAFLFQLASVVDGCDGEVAKLTFRCSKFGQCADTISDNLSLGSFMVGLIAGYWRQTHSSIAFIVGGIMILSTAVSLFWIIRYLKRNTNSASLVTFDKQYLQSLKDQPKFLILFIKYCKYPLKKDVYSFCVFCFAIIGILYWWLFLTAFGVVIAALTLTYLNFKDSWSIARKRKLATLDVRTQER